MQTSFSEGQIKKALFGAQDTAFWNGDISLLQRAGRIMLVVMGIKALLEAFRQCNGRIAGPQGVANALGLTKRNSVYARLKMLGLSKDDFMQQGATVGSLVFKSKFGPNIRDWLEEN